MIRTYKTYDVVLKTISMGTFPMERDVPRGKGRFPWKKERPRGGGRFPWKEERPRGRGRSFK